MSIVLKIEDVDLEMRSCSSCDLRWWRHDGQDVELPQLFGRDLMRQPALR